MSFSNSQKHNTRTHSLVESSSVSFYWQWDTKFCKEPSNHFHLPSSKWIKSCKLYKKLFRVGTMGTLQQGYLLIAMQWRKERWDVMYVKRTAAAGYTMLCIVRQVWSSSSSKPFWNQLSFFQWPGRSFLIRSISNNFWNK